jgi:hypothetical protein
LRTKAVVEVDFSTDEIIHPGDDIQAKNVPMVRNGGGVLAEGKSG